MIELSNTTAQVIPAGQSITFDKVLLKTGCAECHRENTGSVKMRANGIYEVSFAGNISGAVAGTPVQLAFQLGGVTLPETTMVSTPGAANASNNVATSTLIKNCCGDYDIHKVVKPEYWILAEEWACNFIADYGAKIFSIAYSILGNDAWMFIPYELDKVIA